MSKSIDKRDEALKLALEALERCDSYAKAAWIAKAVERNDLTLKDIALMTGDQHRTVKRLLEGYYFINQMIDEGRFVPENSLRKGRGSNPDFPFSWVYTLFGYPHARAFVEMPEEPRKNPVAAARMNNASTLVVAMFGDKTAGRSAAIADSRQLGTLAGVLDSVEKIALLEKGKTVEEIEFETQPIDTKLRDALSDCKELLSDLVASMDATPPAEGVATASFALAKQVNNLATSVAKRLKEIVGANPAPTQQQAQPLTDEEIDSIVAMSCKKDSSHLDAARVARAIEAAHGIKGGA